MRMSDPKRVELARVAYLHYRRGLSQKEIAKRLGKSNMTISRLLRDAREKGVVEFRLRMPYPSNQNVAQDLKSAFPGLRDVVAIDESFTDDATPKRSLGEAASSYVPLLLRDGASIGIGSGETLEHLVRSIGDSCVVDGAEVVQLTGVTGQDGTAKNAILIAQRLAESLGASLFLHPLPSPLGVALDGEGASAINAVRKQADEKWRHLDIGIVGVGSTEDPLMSSRAGFVTPQQLERLKTRGAVGDILLHFFNAEGELVDEEFDGTLSSIPWQQLREIPTLVAIAGGGGKTAAVCGALRSGLVDVLITDEATARAVVETSQS